MTHSEAHYHQDIVVEPLHSDTILPSRASNGSAGYDAHAYLRNRRVKVYSATNVVGELLGPTIVLMPGDRALIPLGFKARMPTGMEAQVRPRSGLALKVGLVVANAPGTIDADFPDEWMVMLENTSQVPATVDHEERVAQIVFARYLTPFFMTGTVERSTTREGGFGSTGL